MYNHLLYLAYWGVNAVVFWGLGRMYPEAVLLGVNKFGAMEAAVYSGFWLTFVVWVLWDFVLAQGGNFGSGWAAYTYFFAANAVGVGVVTVFGGVTGTRVVSVLGVVMVGAVANMLQYWMKEKLLGRGGWGSRLAIRMRKESN